MQIQLIPSSHPLGTRETQDNPDSPRDNGTVISRGTGFMGGKQLGIGDYEQTTTLKRILHRPKADRGGATGESDF